MRKRMLGNTGISVSSVAFGCAGIGTQYGIKVNGKAGVQDEAAAIRLLHHALDRGITLFDTAPAYGESESILGRAFSGLRDQVVIATKPARLLVDGKAPDGLEKRLSESVEASLRALKTDHIDLLQVHDPEPEVYCDAVLGALEKLRESGKVRCLGASTYGEDAPRRAIETGVFQVLQVAYNLVEQRVEGIIDLAAAAGMGVMVRSALMKGILTDKRFALPPPLSPLVRHIEGYLPYAKGSSLPDLALRFVLANEKVSTVLIGFDEERFIDETMRTVEGKLEHGAVEALKGLRYPDPNFIDMAKWTKEGWL